MKKFLWAVPALLSLSFPTLATPITWDFEDLPDCSAFICNQAVEGATYSNSGFSIEKSLKGPGFGLINYNWGMRGTASPAYTGKELLLSTQYQYEFTKDDGGVFSIDSIDLRGALNIALTPLNLTFIATYENGTSSISAFKKSTLFTELETFSSSSWQNITSLLFVDDGFYSGGRTMGYQLSGATFGDPLSFDVPEPGTLALLGIGLAGLAARRRLKL